MKLPGLIIALFFFVNSFSQKMLDMHYRSIFGKEKSFQFFNNTKFHYKLKGELTYRTNKVVNMQDSFLVFDTDSVVKLSCIKAIRIDGVILSPYFFGAGALFFLLDTGHNIAFGREKIVNEQTVWVTAVCFTGGLIMTYFQNKHVRIHKSTTLRIIDANYQNMNSKN